MKTVILAAALMLGGAAVAQDTTGTTTTTTTATTTGTMVAPGNMAPERDARGIAVISAEAAAPPGYNQPAQTGPAGTIQPTPTVSSMGSAGSLPPCSRTVTDRCTQTYERGVRR
jgi:cytoskeletal protein RodZ